MTKICVICKKEPIPGDFTRSFHKFPANTEMRQKWMKAVRIEEIKKVSTVCSDHFGDDSYHQTNGYTKTRRLLSTAVPVYSCTKIVLKRIATNFVMPSLTQDTTYKPCLMDVNEHSCFSLDSPKETNNFAYDLSDEGTEISRSEEISMNIKRQQTITDESTLPKKKFCFMDGCQPSHISRRDFVSDEAWERFIKIMKYKNRQISAATKKCLRRGKQISSLKELVRSFHVKKKINCKSIKSRC